MNTGFPRMVKIRQRFSGPKVDDLEGAMAEQLSRIDLARRVRPGMRVAITAGSRGVANIPVLIRSVVRELKKLGAEPFIVPTMGSHGGATAEGQVEVLHGLGVTEQACEAPIVSSMEVVQIGETPDGLPVYMDRHAREADAVVLMGRVKVHTDFKSPIRIESGLMKMAAIGMGKHKQALLVHSYGVPGIRDKMPEVAKVVLDNANIVCGVAIVENAFEQTALLEAIPKEDIMRREAELLDFSASLMPKLPAEEIDVLVVDEIGKNYSGTGMDTNIIGRMRILGVEEPASPRIKYVIASDLSEASHGNGLGIGLADLTTRRLFDKLDLPVMNENVITSSFLHRAMIPLVAGSDREALAAALRCNWGVRPEEARIVRIPNTLHLEYLYVSEPLLSEIGSLPHIEVVGEAAEFDFDADGYLRKDDFPHG